ncbi:MAG: PIN domain-containing protein [Gammaproteobacteria bacterium]|nr:PIN domain-containing protein [Gammaproteobacteria bacterium]
MKIFLDACAIIYWVELAEPQYNQFANKIHEIRKKHKDVSFAASYLSLLECRVKPMREHQEELLKRYQQFFCASQLTLIAMTPDIIEKATALRAFTTLRTPDAIQAATALSMREEVIFITGDRSFKKVPKLKVLLI